MVQPRETSKKIVLHLVCGFSTGGAKRNYAAQKTSSNKGESVCGQKPGRAFALHSPTFMCWYFILHVRTLI